MMFSLISAWQNLRHCTKWRPDSRPNKGIMPTFYTQSNTTMMESTAPTSLSLQAASAPQPPAQVPPLDPSGAPKTLNKGDKLLQTKVALAQEHLKSEEKKFKLKKEHRLSEVQLNELKILRESEDNLDDKAKEAISLIKKKIKSKWLSSVV
ncbi:hypothetical protein Pst134EB_026313 [Puccinia striiformis f. sp. tritici]|nr:hypothetical protein Pst134EB_026313 [Puccinia striiformis f. sp. tritici]